VVQELWLLSLPCRRPWQVSQPGRGQEEVLAARLLEDTGRAGGVWQQRQNLSVQSGHKLPGMTKGGMGA
jgi:hypothetical protein